MPAVSAQIMRLGVTGKMSRAPVISFSQEVRRRAAEQVCETKNVCKSGRRARSRFSAIEQRQVYTGRRCRRLLGRLPLLASLIVACCEVDVEHKLGLDHLRHVTFRL